MEYLYETVLYGKSDAGYNYFGQSQQDDDSQTFDTSENVDKSNLKNIRYKSNKTKMRII